MSGRYKEFTDPEFYLPEEFRTQVGKPGAYTFEPWKGNAKYAQESMKRHCQDSIDLYKYYIDAGMAKEQARIILPLNLYSEMYWTVNLRSLMNFLSLRNSDQAMWEIREYAKVVEEFATLEMPITMEAFVQNGRSAP
jgi:thymidylate synthase (FAD)